MQITFLAVFILFGLWIFVAGIQWVTASNSVMEIYWRSVTLSAGLFIALTAVPIAAKWLLIGRFKAQLIPIWSFPYFRFWVVKTLMRTSPAAAFIGTPLYNAYMRMMGAKIGHNVVIRSQFTPVCTDLVTIGDNTIISNETSLLGYRAESNFIHIGPITIGRNAYVGEGSVLDIDTAMGDNTQLGHASSLQSGQRVPDDKHYHGSPAIETFSDYCPIEGKNGTRLRGVFYVSIILVTMIMIAVPVVMILMNYVWDLYCPSPLSTLNCPTISTMSTPLLAALSTALFFGALGLGMAIVYVVPRLCMRALRPDVTYPNFGFHYLLQSIIRGVSNSDFFSSLFGDSSAIVWYMRYVGWNLNKVNQTGSNMGSDQKHDNPFLCNIGSGTMVSDGLKMINMYMSATSFRLVESKIGDKNFLGNGISYPPNGRTGTNVLFGTKTLIPIDEELDARIEIGENQKIPVTLEGVALGDAYGTVEAKLVNRTERTQLTVRMPDFHLDVPNTDRLGVQDLGAAEGVRIGVRRSDAKFVALPVQPLVAQTEEPKPLEITIDLGRSVSLRKGDELTAEVTGTLVAKVAEETTVTGEIELRGGSLDVSGKRFEIERGSVKFSGPDPSNPSIFAVARWDSPAGYTVRARYVGTATDGKLTLSSEPPLQENEILNLILFGTPNGSGASGGVDSASSAVGIAGGTAAKGLNRVLSDFTKLDIQARVDTSTGSARPELVVPITRRLSARVTRAIGEPTPGASPDRTFLTLELRLKQRWALSALFGDRGASALDLIWRHYY
jgi:acetyltransferase-like isoleucine patch superfamily enzyme